MDIMGNQGKFTKKQIVDTLVLIHLSKCHDVTRVAKEQDLGTRSGCHSNVPEIKAVFFNFFIYLLTILLVSVVSFRSFRFVVSGFSTCRKSGVSRTLFSDEARQNKPITILVRIVQII